MADWALVLPLALPGYVMAYAMGDLFAAAGPVQSVLRDMTGWQAGGYWFPKIASLPGLAFVLACGLYPYVYLSARAVFALQGGRLNEAAQSLGANGWRRFWQVSLPPARGAIFAGLALALMEAAADFGAADFLGVPTLTAGIVRAWKSFGEPALAARIALVLVLIVFALFLAERALRPLQTARRIPAPAIRTPLTGRHAVTASALCGLVFGTAFGLPVARLVWRSVESGFAVAPLGSAVVNTLLLASSGAGLAMLFALGLSLAGRRAPKTAPPTLMIARFGYAIPGAVLALGALSVLSQFSLALSGAAALLALAWVYACRFTSAGAEPLAAALARAPVSADEAAASLGASRLRRAREIDLPLALPGLVAGTLIVFVEALKELPATLMLRPFGWDTLSVRAHAYASDERLGAAALPALLITLCSLVPVVLLSSRLSDQTRSAR
jgi:iron(III) transport system permease protein